MSMTAPVSQMSQEATDELVAWSEQPDPRILLAESDSEIYQVIEQERQRQFSGIELIASENYVSGPVLAAMGSVLTNKYAEGYPGRRYYGGCQYVDIAEEIAIERAKEFFGAEHANVQPHSGAQANEAVYLALLKPGDSVLALKLDHGGHLSHGFRLNSSGKLYNFHHYGVDPETERIDYDEMERLAQEHHAQADRGRRQRLPALLRLPAVARHCRQCGRRLDDGHGPRRRSGGGRPAPGSGALLRCGHHHHPQDAARRRAAA